MPTLKEISAKPSPLVSGHRACRGCAAPMALRQALLASPYPVVVSCATGGMEVATTIFPETAWNVPWIHNAFENAASTISGVESAYKALKRRGKIDREIKFIAIAGDGGTYDIGLQALSGALERGHDFVYICYDNGAYMNTGIQRSGATPRGAFTTTTPVGKVIPGKPQRRKDLTAIAAAHHIPYVAQANPIFWRDLIRKAEKAITTPGPAVLVIYSDCNLGHGHDPGQTVEVSRLATETCFWPLYEVEDGKYRLTYRPKEKLPVRTWIEKQARFRHLLEPGNEQIIEAIQRDVDEAWEELLERCGEKTATE
ncbi:MAG TPA: pyruvate ferredoxin oxidoreductase [Armatimonadetes bacterium]|nr:pyruvate ferredoxin oxidoreductase [Armatimonadota bacterium]